LERFASLVGSAISNAEAWDKLERQATTDPLTGIANRRAFNDRLGGEIARAQRYGRHLALASIDIDHFKAVNDLHGHPAGDRVLTAFAQLLSAHSRGEDLVARIGGEEFAWLMPETDTKGAYVAANRLREATESTLFALSEPVTVSVGVGSTETAPDADALVRDADRALYWAKDSGRNMALIYTVAAQLAVSNDDEPGSQPTPPAPDKDAV
jgi:diguanylate cyclase (GGDEF)-like protein